MVLKTKDVHQEEIDVLDLGDQHQPRDKIKKVVYKRTENDHLHVVEDQDTINQDPRRKVVKLMRTVK